MGAGNSTLSPGSSVNITNFVRICIVIQTELPNILRELLLVKEPSALLDGHIRSNSYLSKQLRAFEWKVINTVRTKQYADFDVALMYKIIRNLNLVPPPTQGWDSQIPPTSTETTIGDDVERIRRSRNDIVHNVNTNISDVELNNRFSLFIDITSRLEVYLNKLNNREYVSKIENVETCCIDPETEQLYLRQLEDLVEKETTMKSNISAVSHSVDELRQQSEQKFTGLSAKVTNKQTEQEETIPKNIRGCMAGPTYNARGSGSNYLCLTSNPQAGSFPADLVSLPGLLSSMGWELTGTDRSKSLDHIDDKDVPCAVCLTKGKTTLMIPGKTSCYAEWTKEYTGFLVSARNHNDAVTTEYICADDAPEFYGSNVLSTL
ncbi:unnamed protein product [Mytilus coruscus]|uniref:DZIP3-like HEPN domain-containing protein n=1 Tax=Mytilus coruscus TaxID=42192 RepID=A0A6J8APK0_MYTCO|nr:unnamed protein product [Mytilus coruscus]